MPKLSRRTFVATATTVAVAAAQPATLSRPWLGPDYWANPMQDWRLQNGRIECWVAGTDRNVFHLTREVGTAQGEFSMSVKLGRLDDDRTPMSSGFVGFRVGIRGQFSDYRSDAVHGSGNDCGVSADGHLFLGEPQGEGIRISPYQLLQLVLTVRPAGQRYDVKLEAKDKQGAVLGQVQRTVAAQWIEGGVALVCSSGEMVRNRRQAQRGGAMRFWFQDWVVEGSKIAGHADRAFGPIYFAMHTLSGRVLKLTAQLAAMEAGAPELQLQTRSGSVWKTIAAAQIDAMARTATFRVPNWDDTRDTPYRLMLGASSFEGTVRKDPRGKEKLTIGALTCCDDLGFPHNDIVRNVRHFNPDILLFTGDQIYEGVGGYGIQMEPLEQATLDYLRKWLLFGWSFRDLMRDIPTVCLPDDHDVYHGNVWGAAGKKALVDPKDPETAINRNQSWQDSGGFKMPAEWVNTVQRTQTSHLPDPVDPTPVQQGISVYYTSLVYGGLSFAIIEDRKWKSAPRHTIPWADIRNGWAQNPKYGMRDGDVPGAELLGARQMQFLEKWAQDWTGAFAKIVVSQTLWANLCTLPPPADTDAVTSKLPVLKEGEFPEGEVHVRDHDSNGWPQTPRTNALRLIRKAQALHIGGDQHLGSTVQYGIDEFNDGPWMICTPAISNIFPRRWYPPQESKSRPAGKPRYCGEFLDGFGNRITVHAVSNPVQTGLQPATLFNRAVGYGIIEIDRKTRQFTLSNWARQVDATQPGAQPYPGWPVTIHQLDNGYKTARYELKAIDAPSADMVLQVEDEATKEIVYTVRMEGKRIIPRVFREGRYTVRLIPDRGRPRELKGLVARGAKA
jgi:alkaline phosphatase D